MALFRNEGHARLYSPESCRAGPCGPRRGEQTVYSVKNSSTDVILYRGSGGTLPAGWPGDQACANATSCVLLSSSRDTSKPLAASPWTPVVPTDIPDLGSNLNAGSLTDGRVWLVWNGVPRPSINDTQCNRLSPVRNPLTLAISSDGRTFDKAFALYNNTRVRLMSQEVSTCQIVSDTANWTNLSSYSCAMFTVGKVGAALCRFQRLVRRARVAWPFRQVRRNSV